MKKLITILTILFLANPVFACPLSDIQDELNLIQFRLFEIQAKICQLTPMFGTSLTDLDEDDLMSVFPTLYNANLSALNTGKMEISTTTLPLITTLSNLETVGTLSSGSLTTGFTAVPIALGGTGTTSPTTNRIMLGNGSYGLTVASTTGTSGQFLTSGGSGEYPTWATSAIDQSLDYDWTGTHNFGSQLLATDLRASSTVYFNEIDYSFPESEGATSTVLATDGSGNLSWNPINDIRAVNSLVGATTTNTTLTNSTTETTYDADGTITLSAGTLKANGTLTARAVITDFDVETNHYATLKYKLGGTTICMMELPACAAKSTNLKGFAELFMVNNGSESAQIAQCSMSLSSGIIDSTNATNGGATVSEGSTSIDTSSDQNFTLTLDWSHADADNSITVGGLIVTKY